MVNVLTKAQARSLAAHPHVADVESEGMDDERFFVHLKAPFRWNQDRGLGERTKSFGSYREARHWVKTRVVADAPEAIADRLPKNFQPPA